MVQYLEELQGVATPALSPDEMVELEQLRAKYEKLKKQQRTGTPATKSAAAKKQKDDSASSSDSEVSFFFGRSFKDGSHTLT